MRSEAGFIPLLKKSQMSLYWMKCSGDIDGRVPVTSTLYSINEMKLSVKTAWHPWFLNQEVTSFTNWKAASREALSLGRTNKADSPGIQVWALICRQSASDQRSISRLQYPCETRQLTLRRPMQLVQYVHLFQSAKWLAPYISLCRFVSHITSSDNTTTDITAIFKASHLANVLIKI